jgi:hypothetical protein
MKDVDSLPRYANITKWFLRITVVVYIFTIYYKRLITFNLESDYFLIAVFYIFFSITLFFGGFRKSASLTRLSGLALVFLTLVYFGASIALHKNLYNMFASKILLLAVALYFSTSSNWREHRIKRKIRHAEEMKDGSEEDDDEEQYPLILP